MALKRSIADADFTDSEGSPKKKPRLTQAGVGFFPPSPKKTRSQLTTEKMELLSEASDDRASFRDYIVLNHLITDFNQKIASISGGMLPTREILLLNPDSQKLVSLYQAFITTIKTKSTLTILKSFMRFIQQQCQLNERKSTKETEKACNQLLTTWLADNQDDVSAFTITTTDVTIPVVPVEHFIEHHILFCRHISLLTAFLIDQCIKNQYLAGEAHHQRDVLTAGAHSWVVYKDHKNRIFIIDPINFKVPIELTEQKAVLLKAYGSNAVKNMEERYKNTQPSRNPLLS